MTTTSAAPILTLPAMPLVQQQPPCHWLRCSGQRAGRAQVQVLSLMHGNTASLRTTLLEAGWWQAWW